MTNGNKHMYSLMFQMMSIDKQMKKRMFKMTSTLILAGLCSIMFRVQSTRGLETLVSSVLTSNDVWQFYFSPMTLNMNRDSASLKAA